MNTVDSLRWTKFNVLSDGFITLVDVMGDDSSITQAARVSYGNDNPKISCECDKSSDCTKCKNIRYLDRKGQPWKATTPEDDRTLIRYLMRHRHTTPFVMCEVKLLIRIPMDCWRQWIRHRTANVNEYSTRYAEAIDSMDITPSHGWRAQSEINKQGSGGTLS